MIDNKCVFKIKHTSYGSLQQYKARHVAKGCSQQAGVDFTDTFSPVARCTSICIILAISNQLDFHLHQIDVRTTFHNGKLEEDMYMKQPHGFVEKGNRILHVGWKKDCMA